MVKNTTGGKNTKKLKRNFGKYDTVSKIEDGQMFAQIIQNNGSHFKVLCTDNIERIGRLTGALKKGPRLAAGSFVVISLREFEAEQKNCDIIAIGNPPNDIKNIFKKNNPTKYEDDIEFYESDDEFREFEDTKNVSTTQNTSTNNTSTNNTTNNDTTNDDFNWDDI